MYFYTVYQIIIKSRTKNDNLYYWGSNVGIDRVHEAKDLKKRLVFQDFDCQKLTVMENKYHIQSQHAKIHQKNYFSL